MITTLLELDAAELKAMSTRNERAQAINALPDELIIQAKRELESLDWFVSLPNNAAEDDAVFNRAWELQEEQAGYGRAIDETLDEYFPLPEHLPLLISLKPRGDDEPYVCLPDLDEAERIKNALRRTR